MFWNIKNDIEYKEFLSSAVQNKNFDSFRKKGFQSQRIDEIKNFAPLNVIFFIEAMKMSNFTVKMFNAKLSGIKIFLFICV